MKNLFTTALVFSSVFFTYKVLKVLIIDLTRLTEYGYGYLTGQVIFLFLSVLLLVLNLKRRYSNKNQG